MGTGRMCCLSCRPLPCYSLSVQGFGAFPSLPAVVSSCGEISHLMAGPCRDILGLVLVTASMLLAAVQVSYHASRFVQGQQHASTTGQEGVAMQPSLGRGVEKNVKLVLDPRGKLHRPSTHELVLSRTFNDPTSRRRAQSQLLDSNPGKKEALSVRVNLMHRDATDSPLRRVGATHAERMKAAVDRSRLREQSMVGNMIQGHQRDAESSESPTGVVASSTSNNSVEFPISSGTGEYLMPFSIGTPEQSFTTIIDTGSDLVWLQCKPCFHCLRQHGPYFNPPLSNTFKRLNCFSSFCQALPRKQCAFGICVYTYEYGDQSSTAGDFITETLTLPSTSGGTLQVPSFGLGCGHNNHGSFSGAAGLVGLGQGRLSFSSQLSSVLTSKFSYCLVGIDDADTVTSPMFFGDAAVPNAEGVKYTPILPNKFHPTYYYVGLTGISVGGRRLDGIPNSTFDLDADGRGGMVFDSGTTLTMLPRAAYLPVVEAFEAGMEGIHRVDGLFMGLDLCYDVSTLDSVDVPTFTFHFQDADFDVPAGNTFIMVDQSGTLCLALQMSSVLAIFGNIQQQNFQVVYDRVNSRIGFVPAGCTDL